MTNLPISPSSLRGAVDLSGLVNQRPPREGGTPPSQSGAGIPSTDAGFTQVLELSNTVPVIVEFHGQGVQPALAPIVGQYGGRLALVTVDAGANPQLVQAFQVQQLPAVAAVIGGRPMQLFVGSYPDEEVRQVLEQVLQVAQQNGVTGTMPAAGDAPAEVVEAPLPPHHQEAYDAIAAGDFATAIAEYRTAIAQNPRDSLAVAGLAQVSLLQRLDGVDADAVRSTATLSPLDAPAQLAAADLEMGSGLSDEAFERLLGLFALLDPEGRNAVRTRLLDFFEILGADDARVVAARRRLTALLY